MNRSSQPSLSKSHHSGCECVSSYLMPAAWRTLVNSRKSGGRASPQAVSEFGVPTLVGSEFRIPPEGGTPNVSARGDARPPLLRYSPLLSEIWMSLGCARLPTNKSSQPSLL